MTTHWASTAELARRHPELKVDPNPIFVRDGDIWTSAGVTSGMDLSLALVDEDLGREIALEVARWLVLFLQRPGGQAQFSSHLTAQLAERRPLRELQGWIADNLDGDLRVEALAERAAMSPRNFARFFRRETGITPAAYVEELRVERARQLLEEDTDPVELIADQLRLRHPRDDATRLRPPGRRLPGQYRSRFQQSPEPTAPHPERRSRCKSPTCSTTASPPSTSPGPHDVLKFPCPGNESVFVAERPGPVRTSRTHSPWSRRPPSTR